MFCPILEFKKENWIFAKVERGNKDFFPLKNAWNSKLQITHKSQLTEEIFLILCRVDGSSAGHGATTSPVSSNLLTTPLCSSVFFFSNTGNEGVLIEVEHRCLHSF
jgi:hypothetical protein